MTEPPRPQSPVGRARRGASSSRASPSQHLPGDTAATGRARSPPPRGSRLPLRGPPPATAPASSDPHTPHPASAFAGCRPADRSARKTQPLPAPRFRVLPHATLLLPPPLRQRRPGFAHYPRQTHGVPLTGEGRGGAGKGGEVGDRRSRRGDLSSREGSGLGRLLCGNFKLSAKERRGREKEERKQGLEGPGIYIKQELPASKELKGTKTTSPIMPCALSLFGRPALEPRADLGVVVCTRGRARLTIPPRVFCGGRVATLSSGSACWRPNDNLCPRCFSFSLLRLSVPKAPKLWGKASSPTPSIFFNMPACFRGQRCSRDLV